VETLTKLDFLCRFQHHVPFRESKLTHFLQFFFCGAGRVSMVVNINQNSSCFDETLNVLKFSALAQKVSPPPIIIVCRERRTAPGRISSYRALTILKIRL